jgi:hypothetical protein
LALGGYGDGSELRREGVVLVKGKGCKMKWERKKSRRRMEEGGEKR